MPTDVTLKHACEHGFAQYDEDGFLPCAWPRCPRGIDDPSRHATMMRPEWAETPEGITAFINQPVFTKDVVVRVYRREVIGHPTTHPAPFAYFWVRHG